MSVHIFFRLGKSAGRGIRHGGKTEGGSETQNFDSSTEIQPALEKNLVSSMHTQFQRSSWQFQGIYSLTLICFP